MNIKKVIALISALCLSCTLTSCNKNNNSSDSVSDASSSGESSLEGNGDSSVDENLDDDVIMNIGGHDVSVDEYKYYFAYAKYSIDKGNKSYWDDDADKAKLGDIKQQTFNYIFKAYTIYSIADQNNVSLDEYDNKMIDTEISSTESYYNAANSHLNFTFDDYLKNTCCTEDVYRLTLEREQLEYKTIASLYDDDYKKNYFNDYIRVKYINVIPEVQFEKDDNGNKTENPADFYTLNPMLEYSDEEKAEIEKLNEMSRAKNSDGIKSEVPTLMNIIASRLSAGESMDQLMEKYNMDSNVLLNYDGSYQGYYVNKSYMNQPFNDAAFALKDDQTSGIVFNEGTGYYIIQKLAFDDRFLENYLYKSYLGDSDYTYTDDYSQLTADVQKTIKVVYNDWYDDITIDYASIDYDHLDSIPSGSSNY